MNRMLVGVFLAAAGVAVGLSVAPRRTAASAPQGRATPASSQPGDRAKAAGAEGAAPDGKPSSDASDAEEPKKPAEPCESPPSEAGACPCPTGGWDAVIAGLFVVAVIGTVVGVGRAVAPSTDSRDELAELRALVKGRLDREQSENEAARAWSLQTFEALARASRPVDASRPAVLEVQPPKGPSSTKVKILGLGLERESQVLFDGERATKVDYVSASELMALAPPIRGKPGRITVTVVGPTGRSAFLEGAFTYTS